MPITAALFYLKLPSESVRTVTGTTTRVIRPLQSGQLSALQREDSKTAFSCIQGPAQCESPDDVADLREVDGRGGVVDIGAAHRLRAGQGHKLRTGSHAGGLGGAGAAGERGGGGLGRLSSRGGNARGAKSAEAWQGREGGGVAELA